MTTIKPVYDNILIRLPEVKQEEVTEGGIVIKNNAESQVRPDRGIVEAAGDGRITMSGKTIKTKVKKGDEVIFNRFAGTEINLDGESFLMIKECDILAKIK